MQFKVNDVKLTVSPITPNTLKALAAILINDGKPDLQKIMDSTDLFMKEVVFRLDEKAKEINFDEVEYDTIDEIISFFLNSSPKLKQRLLELIRSLAPDLIPLMAGQHSIQ